MPTAPPFVAVVVVALLVATVVAAVDDDDNVAGTRHGIPLAAADDPSQCAASPSYTDAAHAAGGVRKVYHFSPATPGVSAPFNVINEAVVDPYTIVGADRQWLQFHERTGWWVGNDSSALSAYLVIDEPDLARTVAVSARVTALRRGFGDSAFNDGISAAVGVMLRSLDSCALNETSAEYDVAAQRHMWAASGFYKADGYVPVTAIAATLDGTTTQRNVVMPNSHTGCTDEYCELNLTVCYNPRCGAGVVSMLPTDSNGFPEWTGFRLGFTLGGGDRDSDGTADASPPSGPLQAGFMAFNCESASFTGAVEALTIDTHPVSALYACTDDPAAYGLTCANVGPPTPPTPVPPHVAPIVIIDPATTDDPSLLDTLGANPTELAVPNGTTVSFTVVSLIGRVPDECAAAASGDRNSDGFLDVDGDSDGVADDDDSDGVADGVDDNSDGAADARADDEWRRDRDSDGLIDFDVDSNGALDDCESDGVADSELTVRITEGLCDRDDGQPNTPIDTGAGGFASSCLVDGDEFLVRMPDDDGERITYYTSFGLCASISVRHECACTKDIDATTPDADVDACVGADDASDGTPLCYVPAHRECYACTIAGDNSTAAPNSTAPNCTFAVDVAPDTFDYFGGGGGGGGGGACCNETSNDTDCTPCSSCCNATQSPDRGDNCTVCTPPSPPPNCTNTTNTTGCSLDLECFGLLSEPCVARSLASPTEAPTDANNGRPNPVTVRERCRLRSSSCVDCVSPDDLCEWCGDGSGVAGGQCVPAGRAQQCSVALSSSCDGVACASYSTCRACHKDPFCGWCDDDDDDGGDDTTGNATSSSFCTEGSVDGPLLGECHGAFRFVDLDALFEAESAAALAARSTTTTTTLPLPTVTGLSDRVCACGDGVVDATLGEQCDDSNTDDADGCSSLCAHEQCGDGVRQANEQCDDGNDDDDDACTRDCLSNCGNGVPNAGEECDDGNDDDDDDCTRDCRLNLCGNARTDAVEECDDGNMVDDDSCSNDCLTVICGNARVDPGEQCDDGNADDDDECLSTCRRPTTTTPTTSATTPTPTTTTPTTPTTPTPSTTDDDALVDAAVQPSAATHRRPALVALVVTALVALVVV